MNWLHTFISIFVLIIFPYTNLICSEKIKMVIKPVAKIYFCDEKKENNNEPQYH